MADHVKDLGATLRRVRLAAGLTQDELAQRSGLSTRTISDLERGRVLRPRGSSLDLLVGALAADEEAITALVRAARPVGGAQEPRPSASVSPPQPGHLARELPATVPDFTGREHELALLTDRTAAAMTAGSSAPVMLLLSGPPGVGKTALAVRFGHVLAARSQVIQLFAELGGGTGHVVTPADALRQLLASLGVGDTECPAAGEQRMRRYRSLLYHRRALVLLDDAADEAQVRPLLPTGPRCVVVITSRRALEGLSPTLRVPLKVLPFEQACAFLGCVAGQRRLAADPAAASQLVRLCGRLPLALRIAGNQLACRPAWSVAQLAVRLQNDRARLALLSAGDLAVLPTFDASYRQLSARAQTVFRRLPLLPGTSFTADVLDVLCDSRGPAWPTVDELVGASLIEAAAGPDRYVVQDLLRLYARGKLDEQEAPTRIHAVESRVVRFLLDRAAAAGAMLEPPASADDPDWVSGGRAEGLAWLDAERPALVAAAARAAELGLADKAAAAAHALRWYFDLRCQSMPANAEQGRATGRPERWASKLQSVLTN